MTRRSKSLLQAADLNPSDPRAYLFLSKAYDRSPSQANDVIQRFRRFAELQPRNAQASYYYAMSLWKGKRAQDPGLDLQQIESLLKKAIALDPKLAEAHLQLGNVYSDQNKYAEAIPEYVTGAESSIRIWRTSITGWDRPTFAPAKKTAPRSSLQIYQKVRAEHMADLDKQRAEVRQFVYSAKNGPSAK